MQILPQRIRVARLGGVRAARRTAHGLGHAGSRDTGLGALQRIDGETIHDAIPELEKYGFSFAVRTEGQP